MSVRDELLSALEANRGEFISGAELARKLAVSRNAVWKAMMALNESGYAIETEPGRGYRLPEDTDLLSAQSIARHLAEPSAYALQFSHTVSSTNQVAKDLAAQGAQEFTAVVAEYQSAGRGRRGRSFYSPDGSGLYMSILVRPRLPVQEALFMTTIAAVAVCGAIEKVSGHSARIKWVNDVLSQEKKVCGILTEASMDVESGWMEYAIVGIGINVREPEAGFPEPLRDIAGAVFQAGEYVPGSRSRMAAEVLTRFRAMYNQLPEHGFLAEYRARSAVLGRRVQVLQGDRTRPALALDIDDACGLRVRYDDGSEQTLSSGEVSTRLEA